MRLGLSQFILEQPVFVEKTLTKILTKLILRPIHQQMRRDGISRKIIKNTYIDPSSLHSENGRTLTWRIISDYTTIDGFPVSIMIERGRRRFFLMPKPPTSRRKRPTLMWTKGKRRIFSKGHWIPRYIPRRYIYHTIKSTRLRVARTFNAEQRRYYRRLTSRK